MPKSKPPTTGTVTADHREHFHQAAPATPEPKGALAVREVDGDQCIFWDAGNDTHIVADPEDSSTTDGWNALTNLVTQGNSFKAGYGAAQQFYARQVAQLTADLEETRATLESERAEHAADTDREAMAELRAQLAASTVERDELRETLAGRTAALSKVTSDNTPDPDADGTPAGGQ